MGDLTSPSGETFRGIIVTIGGIGPEAERTYADIESIFKSDQTKFKIEEKHDEQGHFKSYIVET